MFQVVNMIVTAFILGDFGPLMMTITIMILKLAFTNCCTGLERLEFALMNVSLKVLAISIHVHFLGLTRLVY